MATPKMKMKSVDKKAYRSSMNLNEREMPEMKDWKVGSKHVIVVEVEMTGIRKESDYASMPMPDMAMASSGQRPIPPQIITGEFKISAVGVDESE